MRFGLIHRIMTGALALLGMASLITSGELPTLVSVTLGVLLVLSLAVPERLQTHPRMRSVGVIGSMGLLVTHSAWLFLGHDPLTVAVEFAAGLQIVRIATRRGGAHDQQIILLGLLHLVAGTVLGGGLAYGLCFLGFLIAAPGALVLSHLRREVEGNYRQGARDRTGLPVDVPRILRSRRVISGRFLAVTCALAIPIFLFTAGLFVIFPRVGLSLLLLNHNRGGRMVGFSDHVDLGKVGKLRSDPTIALRVYLPETETARPARVPLYLRGTAFDTYDGKAWSRDRGRAPAALLAVDMWAARPSEIPGDELMTVDLEPIKPPVIFLPTGAAAFKILSGRAASGGAALTVSQGREGDFQYATNTDAGLRYRVHQSARPVAARLSALERARYLNLPSNLSSRVAALAKDWTRSGETPRAQASQIERRLRSEYVYDLSSPSGGTPNPLEHFLFESKSGHCEYYSTSMAILLRTLGIPSRNVTGFIGGTLNRFGGFYAVRQGDAHSWVEAHLPVVGWTRFDPTPVGESAPRAEIGGVMALLRDAVEAASERWDRHVVGYDLAQQVGLLRKMRKSWGGVAHARLWLKDNTFELSALACLVVVGGAAIVVWRRRRKGGAGRQQGLMAARQEGQAAAALYRKLEDAMRYQGVPRKPETPPLAHANALSALKHPISADVLDLTERYLSARFGEREMTRAEASDYSRRVGAIKRVERVVR